MALTSPRSRALAIAAIVAVACGIAVAVILAGGDDVPEALPSPSPSPSPSPEPSPTPTLDPVAGERTVETVQTSNQAVLGLGSTPELADGALDGVVAAIGDWLDDHLDGLQREGSGRWSRMAPDGLADGRDRHPATRDLTSPDHPVASATYDFTVYHDDRPRLVTTDVVVVRQDDSTAAIQFVFVVDGDGVPTLAMFGPPAPEDD